MRSSSRCVSAVVVSYNVRELLLACVESLVEAQATGEVDEIIVVDSSSEDGSRQAVRDSFPTVAVHCVPNRGYGSAANFGMARARGDALLVLNSDTIVQPGAVRALVEALDRAENVGMVGPRLVHPDGTVQSSRRRFPTRWTPVFESTILEEWFPGNRWCRNYRFEDQPEEGAQPVDWLVGAALLVRREAFERAGGFNESFHMYAEELEWCYRIRRSGLRVVYEPRAAITHHEGASTRQIPAASRLHFDRGRVRAQRLIHGEPTARAVAMALRLNYVLNLVRESLKWALGHRRELRSERIARYWSLARSDVYGDG